MGLSAGRGRPTGLVIRLDTHFLVLLLGLPCWGMVQASTTACQRVKGRQAVSADSAVPIRLTFVRLGDSIHMGQAGVNIGKRRYEEVKEGRRIGGRA